MLHTLQPFIQTHIYANTRSLVLSPLTVGRHGTAPKTMGNVTFCAVHIGRRHRAQKIRGCRPSISKKNLKRTGMLALPLVLVVALQQQISNTVFGKSREPGRCRDESMQQHLRTGLREKRMDSGYNFQDTAVVSCCLLHAKEVVFMTVTQRGPPVWGLHVLLASGWVLSGYSAFLLKSQDMYVVWQMANSILTVGVSGSPCPIPSQLVEGAPIP